jgi:hypothetical protein
MKSGALRGDGPPLSVDTDWRFLNEVKRELKA